MSSAVSYWRTQSQMPDLGSDPLYTVYIFFTSKFMLRSSVS